MLVLLHFESAAHLLQQDGDLHVHALLRRGAIGVVFVLHILPGEGAHLLDEPALQINQRERSDAVLTCDAHVVRTEAGCGVYHAGAVLGSHEIAADHLECVAVIGLREIQQLLVADAFQLVAIELAIDGPRDVLAVAFVVIDGGVLVLLVEVR